MTRITQIEDRGAAVAWSPLANNADVIALGAKDSGGIGFDDYGGELELYDLNITCPEGSPKPRVIGSVKTTSRFSSIGWTPGSAAINENFGMGLLAGGMIDGTVNVWDPAKMMSSSDRQPLLASINRHSGGAVSALQFNPHPASANLLATGGSDGEVLVTSLDTPEKPNVFVPAPDQPKQGAEITQCAWNTQVSHIVASAAGNGTAVVWDLRQKKPWCELRCEASSIAVSDLTWNPIQGLHIVTASADDHNPVLKLWDLRASTTMPLATLEGHSQGVLSVAWCPHDESLLLSCGKDNRTILWDLSSLKAIAEIPNVDPSETDATRSTDLYSGGLSSSQQKRYDVQWSPLRRGVVSTCSFDRKVQAHSVIGAATKCGRPPKWLKPASGVSCGFGGTILSFSSSHKVVKIDSAVEQPLLKSASESFELAISTNDFTGFSRSMAAKASDAGDSHKSQLWGFMQIIFESNAREQLLGYLGFDPEKIQEMAMEFAEDGSDAIANLSLGENSKPTPPMSKKAEDTVKQSLLVGNFEAAVECCFRSGNLADALVLASCGGSELWAKTQAEYFSREAKKRPFLSVVKAVIHNQLEELVAASDPAQWQETLAILSTYGKSDEFPSLCLALGHRLEEAGDSPNACLCYMCALNLNEAVKYWKLQLESANQASGVTNLLALHDFVVKVTVFLQAMEHTPDLDAEVAKLFSDYANALSEQGLLVTAAKYCRGSSQECNELRDRLYRCKDGHQCLTMLGTAPEFPYSMKPVNVAPAGSVGGVKEAAQQQAATTNEVANTQLASNQAVQQPEQRATSQQLPQGWVALQDPSSGRTYYANQSTGETTWEPPQSVQSTGTQAQPSAYTDTNAKYQQSASQQQPISNGNLSATPSRLASKYGDGFVTSASHPELAEQYGNVGTSNPYTGAARPGTAAMSATAKAPVSGTFDPNQPPALSAEHQPIADGLLNIVANLSAMALGGSDKRQLAESEKGVAVLLKRLARGDIDSGLASQVGSLVGALQNRDYATAGAIQTVLVNNEWKEHKDWLKGLKFLIQLASKRL